MALKVSKSKFKPCALEYFRKVEKGEGEIIITDHGRPVLRIMPYSEEPSEVLKMLRGSVLKYEKPTEPVGVLDWEAIK